VDTSAGASACNVDNRLAGAEIVRFAPGSLGRIGGPEAYGLAVIHGAPVNIEKLLAPISPTAPAGESLRYEGTYDRIQEARREDDPTLDRGPWKRKGLKKADWPGVAKLCAEALETRTKDLQIAAWLMEAWIELHGFAGLREGLDLIAALCRAFWDSLYPAIEDGDLEMRIGPIVWIDEKLSLRVKRLTVAQAPDGQSAACTLGDWENACHLERLVGRNPKAVEQAAAEGGVTQESFMRQAMATPIAFYRELGAEVTAAHETCVALERVLDEHCGARAPTLRHVREVLEDAQHLIDYVFLQRGEERTPPPPEPEPPAAEVPADALAVVAPGDAAALAPAAAEAPAPPVVTAVPRGGGPIQSREEAYRLLEEVAEYLLRTEPHSPTPYLIRRAVSWGQKPLAEILPELIRDQGGLKELYAFLGIGSA
jgi:type VI secretion system protein ImpA